MALLCASVLVMYLQRRVVHDLDRQRAVILQKSAEQRAMAIAAELRKTFDGPLQDILAAVNPPLLAADRPDLVAREYARGLPAYPQVERFFMWSDRTEASVPGEVLFYGRRDTLPPVAPVDPTALFSRDTPIGRYILGEARRHARSKRIYAAFPLVTAHTKHDVFLRIFYRDAARTEYFAVQGYAVNYLAMGSEILPALYARDFERLLEADDSGPGFDLRVFDEGQRQVFGPVSAAHPLSAVLTFHLQFYPIDEHETRLAASIRARPWKLVVSPMAERPGTRASIWMQGYWFSGLSVILMLVALGFAAQSHRRAAQLARMQSDFVAQVSHQLKTPVALLSAVGETMALHKGQSPEKLAQYVEIVQAESSRLTSLIERVLEFSRIGDGGRRYEMEEVHLFPLVRETVDAFTGALAPSGYDITVSEEGPRIIVTADPAALEQVLINLLDNAIKYSGTSRKVTVSVGVSGAYAVIAVSDRGIGIAPDQQRRIFERFYRGGEGMLPGRGFGLGLAIAQELVAAQHGHIDVDSTLGSGSTFRVWLPLKRGEKRRSGVTPVPSKETA